MSTADATFVHAGDSAPVHLVCHPSTAPAAGCGFAIINPPTPPLCPHLLHPPTQVYDTFGLDYKMALSTRPEGYLGELEVCG